MSWPSNFHFPIPSDTPAGDYYLYISEERTIFTGVNGIVPIVVTKPNITDIVAGSISMLPDTVAGERPHLTYSYRNLGELPATFDQVVYMSTDPTVTTSDINLGPITKSTYGGGTPRSVTTRPPDIVPIDTEGVRWFAVRLAISEPTTTNNWTGAHQYNFLPDIKFAATQPITWQSPFEPASVNPMLTEGENITFRFDYENVGAARTASSTVAEVYVNSSATTIGARLLGTIPIGVVPPKSGVISSASHTIQVPENLNLVVGANAKFIVWFRSAGNESYAGNNIQFFDVKIGSHIELVMHRPAWHVPSEPELPDGGGGLGSMTWVNLDNDDADSLWDFNPDVPSQSDTDVVGGDNDLVKIDLRLKPASLASHVGRSVKINAVNMGDRIKLWNAASKGTAYTAGASIAITAANGFSVGSSGYLEKSLWIEGVQPSPSVSNGQTTLEMEYQSSSVLNNFDREYLQVMGIQSIEIRPVNNGFSLTTNPRHTRNVPDAILDRDPYLQAAFGIDSFRVVTGSRAPDYSSERDTVMIVVTLTSTPWFGVPLYLRSFDIDDPAPFDHWLDPNDAAFTGAHGNYLGAVDPNDPIRVFSYFNEEDDNRNTHLPGPPPIPSAGKLFTATSQADQFNVLPFTFPSFISLKTCTFQVSRQPGDNYKIAVSTDLNQIKRWQNLDFRDQQRIVDPTVSVDPALAEIRSPTVNATKLLTVKRILHMEVDSMVAPSGNEVQGEMQAFIGTDTNATGMGLPIAPNGAALSFNDGSASMDSSPPKKGRFENGSLRLNATPIDIESSASNGVYFAGSELLVPLPYAATYVVGTTTHTLSGSIVHMTQQNYDNITCQVTTDTHTQNPIVWGNLAGGTLRLGFLTLGTPTPILTAVPAGPYIVSDSMRLPFTLTDDDDTHDDGNSATSVLPAPVGNSSALPIGVLEAALEKCHIILEVDGGNSLANNQANLPFVANERPKILEDNNAGFIDCPVRDLFNNEGKFWYAYVGMAYQSCTFVPAFGKIMNVDTDPNTEAGTAGSSVNAGSNACLYYPAVHDFLGTGCNSSWIYLETQADLQANDASEDPGGVERTFAHEVGHQLGLAHADDMASPYSHGLMIDDPESAILDIDFTEFDANLLRLRFQDIRR